MKNPSLVVTTKGRRRWTRAAERHRWVEAWERSGQSQAEFAGLQGLSVATLRNWVRREAGEAQDLPARPRFVEVDLDPIARRSVAGSPGNWEFEVRAPNGWVVAVAPEASVERLRGLLEALRC